MHNPRRIMVISFFINRFLFFYQLVFWPLLQLYPAGEVPTPTGTDPRRSGTAKVVVVDPYVFPIIEYNALYATESFLRNCPSHNFQPRGAKFPANNRISPM